MHIVVTIIVALFFLICTIISLIEYQRESEFSPFAYFPLYMGGVVLSAILVMFGVIHKAYIVIVALVPIANYLFVSLIIVIQEFLSRTKTFIREAFSPKRLTPLYTVLQQEFYFNKTQIQINKTNELEKMAISLQQEFTSLEKFLTFRGKSNVQQDQMTSLEDRQSILKKLQAKVELPEKLLAQHRADIDQLISDSSKYYTEFSMLNDTLINISDVIEKLTLNISTTQKQLMKDINALQRQINKKKKAAEKIPKLWKGYQQSYQTYLAQKEQVMTVRASFQRISNNYHNLSQKNNLSASKQLEQLQKQAETLREGLIEEQQKLLELSAKVHRDWLSYQKVSGKQAQSKAFIWTSYDLVDEDIFWAKYDQILLKLKQRRKAIIQKAN